MASDLAFQLDQAFAPEFEALRHDFKSSVRQLVEALFSISDGAAALDEITSMCKTPTNAPLKTAEPPIIAP